MNAPLGEEQRRVAAAAVVGSRRALRSLPWVVALGSGLCARLMWVSPVAWCLVTATFIVTARLAQTRLRCVGYGLLGVRRFGRWRTVAVSGVRISQRGRRSLWLGQAWLIELDGGAGGAGAGRSEFWTATARWADASGDPPSFRYLAGRFGRGTPVSFGLDCLRHGIKVKFRAPAGVVDAWARTAQQTLSLSPPVEVSRGATVQNSSAKPEAVELH